MAKRSQLARSAVSRQDSFIDRYTDFALAVSEVTGIAPEVVLGQTALETGWGKSVAGGNMFGIKGAGQSVVTHEDIPGRGMVKTTESFRAYNNPLDSFMDYGDLMSNSRYGHIGKNQTVDQQIASIGKSGYATDRNYGKKLGSVVDRIQENKLFQDKVVNNAASYTPTAEVDLFSGVGIPLGQVEASAIPNLTPAPEAGFSFADFDIGSATLPADFSMDFSQYDVAPMDMGTFNDVFDAGFRQAPAPDFSDITANTAFDPRTSIDVPAPAAPNFSDVDVGTYPDITAGMYSNPMESFTPVEAAPVDLSDVPVGPQPSGFATGFGDVPGTPDFSAPSLEQRNAMDRFEGAMAVRNATAPDLMNESIAQNVMAELGPQTPAMAPAPVSAVTQAPQASPMPQGDIPDEFAPNFPGASPAPAPQAVTQAPQAPAVSLPSAPAPTARTQQQVAKDYDLPSFDLPGFDLPSAPSIRDIGSTLGLMDKVDTSFMNAMANPDIARDWSPGPLDTGWGKGLTGAAVGFATGGPFGALTNGLFSGLGIGDMLGREFDRYANAYANLTPQDFAAFMADGNPYDREPTRRDESGNATVGDGSYAESSGRNSNNPQGIL